LIDCATPDAHGLKTQTSPKFPLWPFVSRRPQPTTTNVVIVIVVVVVVAVAAVFSVVVVVVVVVVVIVGQHAIVGARHCPFFRSRPAVASTAYAHRLAHWLGQSSFEIEKKKTKTTTTRVLC
jgi:hypothetical protein